MVDQAADAPRQVADVHEVTGLARWQGKAEPVEFVGAWDYFGRDPNGAWLKQLRLAALPELPARGQERLADQFDGGVELRCREAAVRASGEGTTRGQHLPAVGYRSRHLPGGVVVLFLGTAVEPDALPGGQFIGQPDRLCRLAHEHGDHDRLADAAAQRGL